jgi:hypothetical protein
MIKRRGEVTAVRDLFSKYKNTLIPPQKTVEMETIRVIGECTGLSIKENQISYTVSTRTVNLMVSGMIKQEIKIKSKEILKELNKRLGAKSSPLQIF